MADSIDFEHIYYATHKRLAEMLREHNKWRRGEPPYDGDEPETHKEPPFTVKELGVLLEEAARRIAAIDDSAKSHFNMKE
ncbi:MAG: hypothetical protein II453_10945 [Alphaproteobacteria bacterium]|nr:hypothetical protein [Alphaproteobacteria bacterium]MBQ4010729.1 hypothetical protein [Bacteroidales bacterium]